MIGADKVLECVSNFSEGNNEQVIAQIATAINAIDRVSLLHIDRNLAANRTVMTFAGEPEAVISAAFNAIKTAAQLIDMRKQGGVHPRIGATDVCPLVPISGITIQEAVDLSHQLGERVGKVLGIPVYMYEESASAAYRKPLPAIRRGQYEGFAQKMQDSEWQPDYGPNVFNESAGATVIGARGILVAFNISLATKDVSKAEYIAKRVRESGYWVNEGGNKKQIKGLLPKVRAIGWYMDDFDSAQVSMNLLDYRVTSPLKVWETCNGLAKEIGVETIGCELIGLMPEICLLEAGAFARTKSKLIPTMEKDILVQQGIEYLALNKIKAFEPEKKILEYSLQQAGLL